MDRTKWVIVSKYPALTIGGEREVIAHTRTAAEARRILRLLYPRPRDARAYVIVKKKEYL